MVTLVNTIYNVLGIIFFSIIANDNPGPSDFSTSGSLIWKNKKVTIKGRSKCYFDEEGNNIYQKLPDRYIHLKKPIKQQKQNNQTKIPLKTSCKMNASEKINQAFESKEISM